MELFYIFKILKIELLEYNIIIVLRIELIQL
jgi:hypothetical protein